MKSGKHYKEKWSVKVVKLDIHIFDLLIVVVVVDFVQNMNEMLSN